MADTKIVAELALTFLGGAVATAGLGYAAFRNSWAAAKAAEATAKAADGNSVTSAFATSQQNVQFWADKYSEIVTKYAEVMATQAAQATEIESLKQAFHNLAEEKKIVDGKLLACEEEKAVLLARALKAEDERSDFKTAFDSLVMMTQMAQENRSDEGLMNVAEERIRKVLTQADKQA